MSDLVPELNQAQPTHINGFASTVQALDGETMAGRFKIRPKHVSTNSEPLMPEARTLAKQAWNIAVVARGVVDNGRLTSDLVDALEACGLANPHIEIETVEQIARHTETGKLKRFVPLA